MTAMMLVLGSLVGSACVAGDDSLGEGTGTQATTIDNRISLNRISLNRISLNRISLNRISLNRISLNHLEANIGAIGNLLDTLEGIELFSFVVSCALPTGTTLVVPSHPIWGTLNFEGEIGLAPRWETRPMTNSDQRWVSACLLARVNNNDVTVQVSLRGPDDALDTDAAERAAWSLEEGAFFGDVFQPDDRPLEMYSCRGRDQASGPETGDMDSRDCAEPDPAHPGMSLCGMTWAGDCADFAPPANNFACETQIDGYYVNCSPTAAFGSVHGHGHQWGHGGGWHWAGHHWGDDDDDDDHGHHSHGHGHGHHSHGNGHGWGHGHGHDCDDDDDEIDEVVTTYLQPAH